MYYRLKILFLTAGVLINSAAAGVYGAESIKIMPLGNSITQSDGKHDSYRRSLWHKLKAGGYNIDFVGSQTTHYQGQPPNPDFDLDHEGHWGWSADQILKKIDKWAATYKPDIVLMHLGHNDMYGGDTIQNTLEELGHIIDILRNHNAEVTVLLAQVIPTDRRHRKPIEKLNDKIPELARLKGTTESPVIVVNQQKGFKALIDTYDGVHPNESGEEKMATKWYAAIVGILQKP